MRKRQIKIENIEEIKDTIKPTIKEFGSVCFRPDLYLEQGRSCMDVKNSQCSYFSVCNCEHLKFGKIRK
jgi:hypothetical protein